MVVDFWATWCGPCRKVGPYIEELAETYANEAIIGKVDVDENDELAMRFVSATSRQSSSSRTVKWLISRLAQLRSLSSKTS